MEIQLKYGNDIVSCRIPGNVRSNILVSPTETTARSLQESLINSLDNPVDSAPLSTMLSTETRLTIVVPDKTRQCILDRILPILYTYVTGCGVSKDRITILFANGTHQPQTGHDMKSMLGDDIWHSLRVEQHNARDTGALDHVTTTSRGTKVYLNKIVTGADIVITVGGILHHYFAGFGGGSKLLIPGVAGYETAKQNHSYTIDESGGFHAGCRDGNLDTNPVYLDIIEAVRCIPNVFSINVILDSLNRPAGFFSGDIVTAHRKGSELAASLYEVAIREQADIVIVSPGGAPRDSTFIQSHKAIHHAFYAVKPGGSIIVTAACYDGIGSSTFLDWFAIPYDSLGSNLVSSYSLNGHTALSLRTKLHRTGISLLSELDNTTVTQMDIKPVASLQSVLDSTIRSINGSPLIYILPYGAITVPVFIN